jgi:hypothetical protein
MKRGLSLISPVIAIAILVMLVPASGHQPFFEDNDFTPDNPSQIEDPTTSTAMYATLETPNDVDYYSFNGSIGQSILLSITIPQIAGQENFTPAMALMGPGLPPGNLPKQIEKSEESGVLILPPPKNATTFFEPFSRTSYWTRQEQYVTVPANSSYTVAVWDDKGQVGRYVFVIGDREILGGDLAFPLKMKNYWTAINQSSTVDYQEGAQASQANCQEEGCPVAMAQPGLEAVMSLISIAIIAFLILKK